MPPKIEGQLNTIIGEGSAFQGKFFVHGSLQLDGKFEGELRVEEHLYVGETGKVKTQVLRAKKITVAGVVLGDLEALEEVKLLSTGRVLGNITVPQLSMEPGVVIKGSILITAGQKKEVEKLIEDAYNSGPSINFDAMFEEKKEKIPEILSSKEKEKDSKFL
ncbi:polymer-forming cytoskeletal protein [Thermospira aquatica]|uniref:Polymer-forming cytoskeletal protein n=1 Tax=Thermospira aquatica TaxID=2828656 RepID=A0AAX3BCX3_9SPIR|nr:polymer-forming cytoskeletal protein [Thermospira aquatica]URA10169.1 polymer-forming cytoskeletal protein [Thermospira aquatica]